MRKLVFFPWKNVNFSKKIRIFSLFLQKIIKNAQKCQKLTFLTCFWASNFVEFFIHPKLEYRTFLTLFKKGSKSPKKGQNRPFLGPFFARNSGFFGLRASLWTRAVYYTSFIRLSSEQRFPGILKTSPKSRVIFGPISGNPEMHVFWTTFEKFFKKFFILTSQKGNSKKTFQNLKIFGFSRTPFFRKTWPGDSHFCQKWPILAIFGIFAHFWAQKSLIFGKNFVKNFSHFFNIFHDRKRSVFWIFNAFSGKKHRFLY